MSKSAPLNAAQAALASTFLDLVKDLHVAIRASYAPDIGGSPPAYAAPDIQAALALLGDAAITLGRDAAMTGGSMTERAMVAAGDPLTGAAFALSGVKKLIKANAAGGFGLLSAGDKASLKVKIGLALDATSAASPMALAVAAGEQAGNVEFFRPADSRPALSLANTIAALKAADN